MSGRAVIPPKMKTYSVRPTSDTEDLFLKYLKRLGIRYERKIDDDGVVIIRFTASDPLTSQMQKILALYSLESK